MKKLISGMVFVAAMGLSFSGLLAQTEPDPPEFAEGSSCFQRMVICNGTMTVYHCDTSFTSENCSQFYLDCYNCPQ